MGCQPKVARRGDRLDAALTPPRPLIAVAMDFSMMSSAKRDRELVADLAAERWTLREAQVMGIARSSPADEARMLCYISEMVAITKPARLRQGQSPFVDDLLNFPGTAPPRYRHAGASVGSSPRRLGPWGRRRWRLADGWRRLLVIRCHHGCKLGRKGRFQPPRVARSELIFCGQRTLGPKR